MSGTCARAEQAQSWQPDTLQLMMPGNLEEGLRTGQVQFFPQLEGIMTLLSRRVTGARSAPARWGTRTVGTFYDRPAHVSERIPPLAACIGACLPPTASTEQAPDACVAAASAWVHLLTINLFAARHIFVEGTRPDKSHCAHALPTFAARRR